MRSWGVFFVALLMPWAGTAAEPETLPYRNPDLTVEARVADLVGRMTLEEKVAQLRPMARRLSIEETPGVFSPEAAGPALVNGTGYVGRVAMRLEPRQGAEMVNAVQRYLIEKTRLGIPALVTDEFLHGYMAKGATAFPQAIALASTWDQALVKRVFDMAAREGRARGSNWALTPVLDVARDPRWGRTEETYGEDVFLASRMGLSAILGLQGGNGAIDGQHVLATAKHFAVHGQPESGTNAGPANYSERIIRRAFLPAFETAVREGNVGSVMASYNEIDGIPVHVNRWLLHDVLRDEWSWPGMLCSDGGGISELVFRHHVAVDNADAARQAMMAGIDIELDGVFGALVDHVNAGRVPMARIDEAVTNVLLAKMRLGLFEQPYVDAERAEADTHSPEAQALALEAARKAIVLLKNDGGMLPLDAGKLKTIAVIGPDAADVHVGGYSYDPAAGVSVLDGIRSRVGAGVEVRYAEGSRIHEGFQGWRAWWDDEVVAPSAAEDAKRRAEAVAVAKGADVAILVVGENEAVCREGWSERHLGDRDSLLLPGHQQELVDAVLATGTPTVVVLINGRALSIPEMAEKVPAILEGFYLGEATGTVVAEVLFGDQNPGGKLPITFPRSVGQLPFFYNHKPSARRGYLFDSAAPVFAFGHGLSYTTFAYANLRLEPAVIAPDGSTRVTVDVTNTGERAGDEVVQLYIRDKVSSVTRPVMELKGFERISLQPGETRTVLFQLGPDALELLDRDMRHVVEPGEFDVMVGGASDAVQSATLEVRGSGLDF